MDLPDQPGPCWKVKKHQGDPFAPKNFLVRCQGWGLFAFAFLFLQPAVLTAKANPHPVPRLPKSGEVEERKYAPFPEISPIFPERTLPGHCPQASRALTRSSAKHDVTRLRRGRRAAARKNPYDELVERRFAAPPMWSSGHLLETGDFLFSSPVRAVERPAPSLQLLALVRDRNSPGTSILPLCHLLPGIPVFHLQEHSRTRVRAELAIALGGNRGRSRRNSAPGRPSACAAARLAHARFVAPPCAQARLGIFFFGLGANRKAVRLPPPRPSAMSPGVGPARASADAGRAAAGPTRSLFEQEDFFFRAPSDVLFRTHVSAQTRPCFPLKGNPSAPAFPPPLKARPPTLISVHEPPARRPRN